VGDFSEVASRSTWNGSLGITTERAYEGSRSVAATYTGGGSGFQRVWQNVDWGPGSDVWYGVALYVPNTSDYCYWNPIRWDNYKTYGGAGDTGGVTVERGHIYVTQDRYSGAERKILDGGPLPEGRWVWLEVHQRLSAEEGQALTELYVDSTKVGSTTAANSLGRVVNNLRAGVVNVAGSCSNPGKINFDRVSIGPARRGALH